MEAPTAAPSTKGASPVIASARSHRRPIDLVGQLLQSECTWLESSFQREDAPSLQVLQQAGAVIGGDTNLSVALCGFCGLEHGAIFRTEEGLMVRCPDCGPYPLDPASVRTWRLNRDWLIRRLRGALDIAPHAPSTQIDEGIWEIGRHKKRAVILVRSIDLAVRQGLRLFHNAPGRGHAWVITPRPYVPPKQEPLAGIATWWQLEERFAFHGMALRLLGGAGEENEGAASGGSPAMAAVHGPFSEDFGWVHLDGWPAGPIRLSSAQSRLFAALWKHRREAQPAEILMREAGLASERPMDVFKVKASKKGEPTYEGPLEAYERLVARQRRLGLYQLKIGE